jgi:hypothetical protein
MKPGHQVPTVSAEYNVVAELPLLIITSFISLTRVKASPGPSNNSEVWNKYVDMRCPNSRPKPGKYALNLMRGKVLRV